MEKIYLTSKKYSNSKISFGFFTRKGGFSSKKFFSLNCNLNASNKNLDVKKNILTAQKKLLLHKKKIKFVSQIHSNKTIIINHNNYLDKFDADGIITQEKEICIAVLTADCCPIFLFDKESKFICCLHAGWRGVLSNLIERSFNQIIKIQPNIDKIIAVIGPCLKKDKFDVSADFKTNFIQANSNYRMFFKDNKINTKSKFDMKKLIKFKLSNIGIKNIDDINIDTYTNENLFFSHRRSMHLDQIPTGRMINIIGFR